MTKVEINPGICGLKTTLSIESEDMQMAKLIISSDCPHIMHMQEELSELDAYIECFSKLLSSNVYKTADKYIKHVACPVPSAIIKGIEVECGLALPKEAVISINKE